MFLATNIPRQEVITQATIIRVAKQRKQEVPLKTKQTKHIRVKQTLIKIEFSIINLNNLKNSTSAFSYRSLIPYHGPELMGTWFVHQYPPGL